MEILKWLKISKICFGGFIISFCMNFLFFLFFPNDPVMDKLVDINLNAIIGFIALIVYFGTQRDLRALQNLI